MDVPDSSTWSQDRCRGRPDRLIGPRNITAVYLIQWVLIGWLAIALGVHDLPSWLAALLGVPILVASHLLAVGYGRLAAGWRRERESRPSKRHAGSGGGGALFDRCGA
jgi:hypothetical protein